MVSRSDGESFHLFLEDSFIRPTPHGNGFEIVDLFAMTLTIRTCMAIRLKPSLDLLGMEAVAR
jgi:hypothetical protein